MRYISIDHVEENEILASDVYDIDGRVMVAKGMALSPMIISRLKDRGFQGVYIGDPVSCDIEIPQNISPELREMAKECIKSLNIEQSVDVSKSIIREIMDKQITSFEMTDIRAFDDYTYAHSVNVAVLSCVIGIAMKLEEKELYHLVNAAILHDFGKMRIPEEVINKTGRLTGEEYELIKTHVEESYRIIEHSKVLDPAIKLAVLSHHENEDGSGYPNGVTGDKISMLSKILHVADVYDALVSTRPYKKGYAPWEAIEYLMGGCGICFDKRVVDVFVKLVPLYPIGATVRLSTMDECVVIANKGPNNLRPVVRRVSDYETIDLARRENISIAIYSQDETYLQKSEAERQEMIEDANQRRIVIVDDMKTNLQMLREILSPEYKVIPFKSGRQTLHYLSEHSLPDLLLLDIDMPEMSGTDLARRVREQYGDDVPILFVSALTDKKTVILCRELKASGYVARPYQPIYILSEIKRILDGRAVYE